MPFSALSRPRLPFREAVWLVTDVFPGSAARFPFLPTVYLSNSASAFRDLVSRPGSRDDLMFALKARLEPWIDCEDEA